MSNLNKAEAGTRHELVPTSVGTARLDWFPAQVQPRAVACRTAAELGALAVLALAYPLLGPGSPRELLATDRPTLIIQGGSDPFGRPAQFPPLPPKYELVEIPGANHMFTTSASRLAPLEQLTGAAAAWIDRQLPAAHS